MKKNCQRDFSKVGDYFLIANVGPRAHDDIICDYYSPVTNQMIIGHFNIIKSIQLPTPYPPTNEFMNHFHSFLSIYCVDILLDDEYIFHYIQPTPWSDNYNNKKKQRLYYPLLYKCVTVWMWMCVISCLTSDFFFWPCSCTVAPPLFPSLPLLRALLPRPPMTVC